MLLVVPPCQQPRVQPRVQRLHPPVHHLGKAGEVLDRAHRDPRPGELACGAAGRDDLDAELRRGRGRSSTIPALSDTDSSALRTRTSPGAARSSPLAIGRDRLCRRTYPRRAYPSATGSAPVAYQDRSAAGSAASAPHPPSRRRDQPHRLAAAARAPAGAARRAPPPARWHPAAPPPPAGSPARSPPPRRRSERSPRTPSRRRSSACSIARDPGRPAAGGMDVDHRSREAVEECARRAAPCSPRAPPAGRRAPAASRRAPGRARRGRGSPSAEHSRWHPRCRRARAPAPPRRSTRPPRSPPHDREPCRAAPAGSCPCRRRARRSEGHVDLTLRGTDSCEPDHTSARGRRPFNRIEGRGGFSHQQPTGSAMLDIIVTLIIVAALGFGLRAQAGRLRDRPPPLQQPLQRRLRGARGSPRL